MNTNTVKDASKLAEKHYFAFLDNAPDIVFTVDLDGKFLYINKTANRITGVPVPTLLKSNLHKIAAPAYKDVVKRFFQNSFKGKSIPLLEIEVLGSNGKQIPLEIHIERVHDKNGKLVELQGIARDISKRKKAMDEINHLYKESKKQKRASSPLWTTRQTSPFRDTTETERSFTGTATRKNYSDIPRKASKEKPSREWSFPRKTKEITGSS